MANKLLFEVDITTGNLKLAQQDMKKLSAQIDGVGAAHSRAGKEADTHYHKQGKGIIGTANSTKSFSKLAQSINGDNNSLVGAYAALAANIFAVTAAFMALKNAAEVQQVIEGLTASGARLGLTYKNAITEVGLASEGLLTLEQRARSSAQVLSAGFKTDQLVRITKAAKDTSFALGRDMGDSMDRLTRGVIKLEPELLDELGIMVRLDEASVAYARSLGKSTSALTSAEKRQGFFNAVLAEAEAKFGGLATGADTSAAALNKMATVFNDLTKTIFNGMNVVFVPFAKLFSSSPAALLGGMLLFASSIKGQLIPGLVGMAENSAKAAEKARDLATQNIAADVAAKRYLGRTDLSKEYFKSLTEGSYDAQKAQSVLAQAQGNYQVALIRGKLDTINGTKAELAAVTKSISTMSQASAIQSSSNAQVLASMGNYKLALKEVGTSIRHYASGASVAALNTGIMGKAGAIASTSMFALGVSVRTAGVAFLTFLPWLGLITVAVGLLYSGIKILAGEGYAKLSSSTKAYNEVLNTSKASLEQYNKLNESTASTFTKISQQAKIAGNSITELVAAYKEVAAAQSDASGLAKFLTDAGNSFNLGRQADIKKFATTYKDLFPEAKNGGQAATAVSQNYELIKTFDQMKKYKGASGIINEVFGKDGPKTIGDVRVAVGALEQRFSTLASSTEEVENAFKQAGIAGSDFIKSATPSTPYDALSNSLYNVNKALSVYSQEIGKGSQSTEDLKKMLTGLGPEITQFMNLQGASSIEELISSRADGLEIAREQVFLVQEEFDNYRKISLEAQGQLAIAQARLTVAGRSQAITGAETANKINAENNVIKLQTAQLKLQVNVLDSIIAQNKAKRDALYLDQESLDKLKEKSELELISANQLIINSLPFYDMERGRLEFINEQLRKKLELNRGIMNSEAARSSLVNQISAAEMTMISETQKAAAAALTNAEKEVYWAQRDLTVADNRLKVQQNLSSIEEELLGYSVNQRNVESALKSQYVQKVELIKKESDARVASLNLMMSQAQTDEQRAEISKRLNDELLVNKVGLVEQIKIEYDLNRIKAAGFKIESDRLSMAKNLLDIQLQQAEAVASAAEAQTALNIRQKRFEAGSRQLTATEERQLAFEAAEAARDAALATQELKTKGIKAEYALLDAQYALEEAKLVNSYNALNRLKPSLTGNNLKAAEANMSDITKALDAYANIRENLGAQETAALDLLGINIANLRLAVQETGTVGALSGQARTFSATQSLAGKLVPDQDGQLIRAGSNLGFNKETILALSEDLSPFIEDLKKLGPQGEYVSAVVEGALIIADSFRRIGEAGLTSSEGLSAVGSVIGQIAKIAQSSAQAKIAAVDQEIAAEQKRDGKSSESLARIQAMEKKKDAMAKKAFEVNKKLMIAQAVMSTASAVVGALGAQPWGPWNIALAAGMAAMGAAQIGIIAGTSYQSSSTAAAAATPSAVSVGKRSDSVNLARNNSTPGGELGYLTGAQGSGTNASNFRPRAYGGYGHAGMIVGEKGPEVFTPSVPGYVTPSDKVQGQQVVPVNFHINAIDAEGVEQVLTNQRGHIIGMLREAANANGERFLENIDTNKYKPRGRRI